MKSLKKQHKSIFTYRRAYSSRYIKSRRYCIFAKNAYDLLLIKLKNNGKRK